MMFYVDSNSQLSLFCSGVKRTELGALRKNGFLILFYYYFIFIIIIIIIIVIQLSLSSVTIVILLLLLVLPMIIITIGFSRDLLKIFTLLVCFCYNCKML